MAGPGSTYFHSINQQIHWWLQQFIRSIDEYQATHVLTCACSFLSSCGSDPDHQLNLSFMCSMVESRAFAFNFHSNSHLAPDQRQNKIYSPVHHDSQVWLWCTGWRAGVETGRSLVHILKHHSIPLISLENKRPFTPGFPHIWIRIYIKWPEIWEKTYQVIKTRNWSVMVVKKWNFEISHVWNSWNPHVAAPCSKLSHDTKLMSLYVPPLGSWRLGSGPLPKVRIE